MDNRGAAVGNGSAGRGGERAVEDFGCDAKVGGASKLLGHRKRAADGQGVAG